MTLKKIVKLFFIISRVKRDTVEPVYNELGYNEYPLITNHIVCTNSLDFFKKWTLITNPGYNEHFLLHRPVRYKRV